MYYINYQTGAGNDTSDTLEEAKRIADEGAAYTRQPIVIEDEDGNEVSRRSWYGVEYNANEYYCVDPILFGSFGFYSDWTN